MVVEKGDDWKNVEVPKDAEAVSEKKASEPKPAEKKDMQEKPKSDQPPAAQSQYAIPFCCLIN